MNKKEKLAFAVVAALAMTSGGFAYGQSVNNVSSDQVIYACVTGVNGNITKVSNTPKTCPKGTTPISWNMVGPKGEQGLQGLQGLKGDQGVTGISNEVSLAQFISPDGTKSYPATVSPYGGYLVKVGDRLWTININGMTGKPAGALIGFPNNNFHQNYLPDKDKSFIMHLYESSDCSGLPYMDTTGENEAFSASPNIVYTLYDGNTYVLRKYEGQLASIQSMSWDESFNVRGECQRIMGEALDPGSWHLWSTVAVPAPEDTSSWQLIIN
jgi:hypothetical protein